jgi:hypothetical protein
MTGEQGPRAVTRLRRHAAAVLRHRLDHPRPAGGHRVGLVGSPDAHGAAPCASAFDTLGLVFHDAAGRSCAGRRRWFTGVSASTVDFVAAWPAVATMTSRHSTRRNAMAALPPIMVQPLRSARLDLEPLRIDHAAEAAVVFDDERLHRYIGGAPANEQELRRRYARQVAGRSADGRELWLN